MNPVMLIESNFDTQVLNEGEGKQKKLYIQGIFMQADIVNGNKRIYSQYIVDPQVQQYIDKYVNTNRAVGELDHPKDRVHIDLRNASHLITKITKDGSNYLGKARILENTPVGGLVKGLIEGDVCLGVSSRGWGSTQLNNEGVNVVQSDFKLATIDIVYQPSAPDAFVEGLMENANFVWGSVQADKEFIQTLKEQIRRTKSKQLQESKADAFNKFIKKFS